MIRIKSSNKSFKLYKILMKTNKNNFQSVLYLIELIYQIWVKIEVRDRIQGHMELIYLMQRLSIFNS